MVTVTVFMASQAFTVVQVNCIMMASQADAQQLQAYYDSWAKLQPEGAKLI
jgi:hypothetical protein